MVRNIFSSLMHERTPGVIKEFVLWCVVCVSAFLSLIAAAIGGGNAVWVMLFLFTLGLGVLMAFRLTPIVLLYSVGVFQFLIFIIHYTTYLRAQYYYGVSGSALITVLFVLLLLLSLVVLVCAFIQFFSRVSMGTALMILVITDSALIMLFQLLACLSIASRNGWYVSFGGAYWIGTISYWMILVVVLLLYVFFFRGFINNRKKKIVDLSAGAGKYSTAPGIMGVSGAYAGRTVYLNNQMITLGSGSGVTVVIQDQYVSAEHCAVRFNPSAGYYEIYDNSPYGVYLNGGSPIQKGVWCRIRRGSIIGLGNSVQKFRLL